MMKSDSNGAAMEDVESREAIVNSNIEEFMMLRKSVENSNEKVEHWTNQTSKLLESNSNIDTAYEKLMMKVSDIDEQMSETMRIRSIKKQELEDLQKAREGLSHKKWGECLSEVGNYADNFCRWITEYSNDVLMKDIKDYHEECNKVSNDLAILKQEVNDMQGKHDADNVEANMDLSNLDTIISDLRRGNNNLTHTVRSTENSLKKIQNKIKKCKVILNGYKEKEDTDIL
ncbi:PREDICTED: uncharacterized protein LOC106744048 [Dinoponera quadriceps]|uniref:Uncharacterized protein LOC106744048 n=1 Tax=Dinoponera quadriceps TaxID=609295 RepID=A0A6P3X6B9_DINQU|nr:PREDICTED: uncharacterized protein LOC106744048 [Dinoponera quadriceps]